MLDSFHFAWTNEQSSVWTVRGTNNPRDEQSVGCTVHGTNSPRDKQSGTNSPGRIVRGLKVPKPNHTLIMT